MDQSAEIKKEKEKNKDPRDSPSNIFATTSTPTQSDRQTLTEEYLQTLIKTVEKQSASRFDQQLNQISDKYESILALLNRGGGE